jgi:2-iminobutanoate/2-iminopropanoate deaminase
MKERTMTHETDLTKKRRTAEMNPVDRRRRNFIGALAAVGGVGAVAGSSPSSAQTAPSRQFIKREASQRSGYSQAVITQGGRTIWLAGHTADPQADPSLVGNFEGQVRAVFAFLDDTLQKAGGKLSDIVTMSVSITDPRNHSTFTRVRREILGDNFPASAVVSVSHLALPSLLVEVQAVAVVV